jgi:drug/metabolite transporter (DMT)-like permease
MQANVIKTGLTALRILIIALGCIWVVSAINSDDPNGPVESLVSLNLYTGVVCVLAIFGFGIYQFAQKLMVKDSRAKGALIGFAVFFVAGFIAWSLADTTVTSAMLMGGATVTEQDVKIADASIQFIYILGLMAIVSILLVEGKAILKNWL